MENKNGKRVGIVCDLYKEDRFKKALDKADFKYEVSKGPTHTLKLISVLNVPEKRMDELAKLVKRVEHSFHNSN